MLNFTNFSYSLGNKTILNKISFTLKEGEKVILIGENGSGKSTFLRVVSRAYPNAIFINTYKRIFYLDDDFFIPGNYLVRDYLLKMALVYDQTLDIDYYMKLLSLENKKIKALSKGNKQKVGLLLGLISKADLILLDEALDGLDKKTINNVVKILSTISSSIVIVTHYAELITDEGFKKYKIKAGVIYEAD